MALLVRPVDPRDLAQLREISDRLGLDRHDPLIANTLRQIDPERPAVGDWEALQSVRARVRTFIEFHRNHPFKVMPRGALQGSITVAFQRANGAPILRGLEHCAQHLGVFGATGFGKSTFIIHLLRQLLALGVKLIIPDRKDDTRALAAADERFLILYPDVPFNLIQRAGPSLAEHITNIVLCFARAFFGGEHFKQVFTEALERAFAKLDHPCLGDVLAIVEAMSTKGDTFARRDAITGLILRLKRFAALFPGMFTTRVGITLDQLFARSVYLPITMTNEGSELALTLLVHQLLFHKRREQQRGGLTHVIVLDEGLSSWNAQANNIDRQPLLSYVQSMIREFSIGMIVSSTSIQLLDPLLKSNLGTQVVMNLTNAAESSEVARTFGLTPEEHQHLNTQLVRGECLIKLASDWRHPILATFPQDTTTKQVAPAVWNEAIARTNRLAPSNSVEVLAAREEVEPMGQQPAAPAPPASPSPTIAAPVLRTEPSKTEAKARTPVPPRALELTATELALLRVIGSAAVITTTAAYEQASLHPQVGTRARTKLVTLGFAEQDRLRVHGRRGGSAVGLRLTAAGYERAGIRRPHGTRGHDSLQHEYLVRALAAAIPGSVIEAILGTKSVDLLLSTATSVEKRSTIASVAGIAILPPNSAIEVEVSSAERTGLVNIEKNRAVGVTLTILAVMPEAVDEIREIVSSDVPVVSVFALLEALR